MIFVRSCLVVLVLIATPLLAQSPPASDPGAPPIKDIVIAGNRRIERLVILSRIQTRIGDSFSPSGVRDDVRAVFGLGFFTDVQVRTEELASGVRVIFVVVERPLVREVSFEGNREVKTDELREAAVRVGEVYSLVGVQLAVDAIRQKYETEGFVDFTISPRAEHTPEGNIRVVFQIDEGRKSIDRLLFERLAGLAPHIDSRHPTFRSFEFMFLLDFQALTMRIRCWVDLVAGRACIVLNDGIPTFVATGDKVIMYNPIDGLSYWQADWRMRIGEASGGQIGWALDVLSLGNASAGVEMDLRPLPKSAVSRRSVQIVGDQRFFLQAFTPKGGQLEASIDLTRPIPYSRLRATFPEGGALELESVKINESIPPAAFQLPTFHKEGLVLPSPKSVTTMEDVLQAMRLSTWTDVLIRVGIKDPEARAKAESNVGRPIDWSAVASRDATMGQALKHTIERHLQSLP